MKINGNEIRPGNVIEHNSGLWVAVKTNAVKPGKGGAFNQVELTTAAVRKPAAERRRAQVGSAGSSGVFMLITPCEAGVSPVSIEACEGRVQGEVALASSKRTPSDASMSITGEVKRPYP